VDEVVVTTLVDNVYDALLGGQETITRAPFAAGIAQALQFESGATQVGLMAEHGFSALAGHSKFATLFSRATGCASRHPSIARPIIGRAITPGKPYGIKPTKSLMIALVAWRISADSRKLPTV
jgi:hypothetical protein